MYLALKNSRKFYLKPGLRIRIRSTPKKNGIQRCKKHPDLTLQKNTIRIRNSRKTGVVSDPQVKPDPDRRFA